MSLRWPTIFMILLFMAIVSTSEQIVSDSDEDAASESRNNEPANKLSIPPGLASEVMELQRLEALQQPDPTVVEKFIGIYEGILSKLKPKEYIVFRAAVQAHLGKAYFDRIRGDKAENIETAIQHYSNALQVRTNEAYPVDWAETENNLGNAYFDRIRGDKAENIETAIQHYNNALQVRTNEAYPVDWATTENNLGNAYKNRIRGDRAENIEIAIKHYNNALQVRTSEAYPVGWATTENNLGNAYGNRIRGDRAENIEIAIKHLNNALQVRTSEAYPIDWAATENNLGNAYGNRIRGDRAENIEIAIQHLNDSLKVHTREAYPVDWATTENNLGNAYKNRIRGDRAENIEIAIQHYCNSLQVRTHKAYPVDWATTENNLGNAYLERIRGDRAENIEMAIQHYSNSLQIRTRDASPVDWAMTENNLGNAYKNRIRGDRAKNIEMAIKHYSNSLQIRTRDASPVDWAATENNLGYAYGSRIRGDLAENIEIAIQYYSNALQVFTIDASPVEFAITEGNLGNAYVDRIRGDPAENIERAIKHYNNALQVFTRKNSPVDWAATKNNLGNAYKNRIRGDRAENIEMAIELYQNALQIRTASSLPREFLQSEKSLGNLYFKQGQWEDAFQAYKKAIAAGDYLYNSGLSAVSKSTEIRDNSAFYPKAAFAAARLNRTNEALLILEQGKTRVLTEALRLRMQRPDSVPDEVWKNYEMAAEAYRVLQATPLPKDYSVEAQSEREQEFGEALEALDASLRDVQKYVPSFQRTLELSDIQGILDKETLLISFCVTDKGSLVFVVSRFGLIRSVDVPGFNTTDLNRLVFQFDDRGYIGGGWIQNISESPDIIRKTIDCVMAELGQKLLDPVIAEIPDNVTRLILLPSDNLFLLPIHAAPLTDGRLICDRFCVSYAPSIPLLLEMKNIAEERVADDSFYAVVNPTEDLVFSQCEGKTISRLFQKGHVEEGLGGTRDAVLSNIRGQAYLHFSCHGYYNWNDPPQSGLKLANDSRLTLSDLQNGDGFTLSARLVTLSACESGISDVIFGSPEEFVGLPAGFMLSGVPCIVSSLWSVPDISTSLLMEKFYSNYIEKGMDIPSALQEAQNWVRNLTSSEVAGYVNECISSSRNDRMKTRLKAYSNLAQKSPNAKPFVHPYYWAAFTVNGA